MWCSFHLLALCSTVLAAAAADFRGARFIGYDRFSEFEQTTNENSVVLLSPLIDPAFPWNELVASWNYRGPSDSGLNIETRVRFFDHETAWYCLGKWSRDPKKFPRESVNNQEDADGAVATDILKMKRPGGMAQIRVTVSGGSSDDLKFVGLSFCDSKAKQKPLPANLSAWGKTINVPERSQANYPEGISEWCSPTSTSMLLHYWAGKLGRPELEYDVPEVARGVHDPNWPGTGNWPFNTAFAGYHSGIRAYVTRFCDVSELEDWIREGIPVITSVSYGYLKGTEERGNGHLVVCVGFTATGDIVVNDPGRLQVRQTYSRENLISAWAQSKNTVYLIYPESTRVPEDRFGHWFSR